jgi:S-adenosylmethionine decarboxylase
MRPQGLHIIADLFECDLASFALTEDALADVQSSVSGVLKNTAFNELGNIYHFFGPSAATGVVCLAESHVTFHTWPEDGYVSVDLFLCNSTPEREEAGEKLLQYMVTELFRSKSVKTRKLTR